jgi:hypothetical protein
VYKILLESQLKEKPIAYTKWEKCLKKDRMHTLTCTCITHTLFFTFNYLELNKLKIFKWKLIHFILPCKELLKQWRIVNTSDCLVCTEKENYKHFYFDCKYNKKCWKEVKKMTTNLYTCIGDHVFNLESLVFGYKIYDQAYFDLNLLRLSKLRISAHKLQIEIGRYQGTLRENRICCRCTSGHVEDEIHYLLHCKP